MKKLTGLLLGVAIAGLTATASFAADTIKIAFIDPLSGPFAATGQQGLAQYKFAADELINKNGGVLGKEFEIVAFDNKISPKESLIQLAGRHRPGHPFHRPGQLVRRGQCADRCHQQAQQA